MKIAIDVMGAENSPNAMIDASLNVLKKNNNHIIYLYGDENIIKDYLSNKTYDKNRIIIKNCTQVVDANISLMSVLKDNKDSSMIRAMNDIKNKEVDIMVSSGSTAAMIAASTIGVGRIKGIKRPVLSVLFPSYEHGVKLMLDVGANAEVGEDLLEQFAVMGHFYAQLILKKENPKIGLINIGEEEKKGTEIYKKAYQLLKNNKIINFVGNIEPFDIPMGRSDCDVYICDGFTGNIVLKLTEGCLKMISKSLKDMIYKNTKTKIGGLFLKEEFSNFKDKFTKDIFMGAALLGIKEAIVKAHGNSDAKDFEEAIDFAIKYKESNIIEKIEKAINENI